MGSLKVERLKPLHDHLAECAKEADALGQEPVGFLVAMALQEIDAQIEAER